MNESNPYDLTSGEGSILIEIVAEALPITPEVLRRPRVRPAGARFVDPPPDSSPTDPRPAE